MIFKNTVILLLTLAFLSGFPDGLITFTGRMYKLEYGRMILLFTCSSKRVPKLPYAEFLINDKTTASSSFNKTENKCFFFQESTDCGDVCKCSSDGKTFTWTFPMPSSKKIMCYSCHMFIKSKYVIERAVIMFNGTDFSPKISDDEVTTSFTRTTTKNVQIKNNEIEQEGKKSKALYVAVAVILSLLVIIGTGIFCFLLFKKGNISSKKRQGNLLPQRNTKRKETKYNQKDHQLNHLDTQRNSCKPRGITDKTGRLQKVVGADIQPEEKKPLLHCIQIRTSENDDHEETLLTQGQKNTAIDQVKKKLVYISSKAKDTPRVNNKTEEQNLVKLNRLITKVGMKLMRAYFRKHVLQENHLVSFLETNKHLMFHAMHPKRRCCQCLREKLDINHLGVLLKQHFYRLYSKEIEPCDFSCQTQCICIYTPQKTVVLETLDLSTLIGIVSAVSTGTATFQNLIQVRTFCKEIIQYLGTGSVPNNEFKIIWEKIKTFFLTLARDKDLLTGDLPVTGDEMQSLYEEKIEKTTDEFAEVLLQWKNFDELSNQESDEIRFQDAAKCFGQFTSNRMKLCKLNHLEVYLPDLANDPMEKNYMKDKTIQRALVRIGIPQSWDLESIVSTFIEVTKTCSIQISEKTLDGRDFMFVANINKGLDDKTLLETELLKMVEDTVCLNGIDLSSQDKMQIDIALSKDLAGELSIPTLIGREPVKMYLQRVGPRYINSFALLSDNEVVFTEVYKKALVIYNFKTQVRHHHDLPGIPFDMIVLTQDQFAVTFSDSMGIYQYSISDSELILINNYKMNEQCLSIGKRDESSLYVFIENKGLVVLNLLGQPSATFESMLSGFDPRHDSITFSDIYIYYTNRSKNSVYCYDIEHKNIRLLDGTFNNPSSIASLQDCVFVGVNDNCGAVYVKRVDGLFHQVILTKADGLECSNIIHFYENMSCLMFVNKKTGFAAIHKPPCFGAQVAISGKSKATCS